MGESRSDITMLIADCRRGDAEARERLFVLVYDELREIARRNRFVDRHGGTMQPTALANEAYVDLQRHFPVPPSDQPESRATFFRAVAQAMRTILRDHWRKKQAAKRGGDHAPVALGEHDPADRGAGDPFDADFLALDEALDRLEDYDERMADIVKHRYFAGRSIEETAELLGVGVTTVKEDWKFARAWLRRELGR